MKEIIIYGSKYGSAKRYAEELSKKTGIPTVRYEDAGNIGAANTLVYIGAVYAGGILGLKKTLGKLKNTGGKKIVIATVALGDPKDKASVTNLRKSLKRQLSDEMYSNAKIFHLRGGVDYSKMGFMDKKMMGMMYRMLRKKPQDEQSADVRIMLETYNKTVDLVDLDTLSPIVEYLKN